MQMFNVEQDVAESIVAEEACHDPAQSPRKAIEKGSYNGEAWNIKRRGVRGRILPRKEQSDDCRQAGQNNSYPVKPAMYPFATSKHVLTLAAAACLSSCEVV